MQSFDHHLFLLGGGAASNLLGLCSDDFPKFALKYNEKSLLDLTIDRFSFCLNKTVVISSSQKDIIHNYIDDKHKKNLCYYLEPFKKGTLNAIALPVYYYYRKNQIENNSNDFIFISSHLDQLIFDTTFFKKNLLEIIEIAKTTNNIILVGTKPTSANTSFGYIESKGTNDRLAVVTSFKEKPDECAASSYVNSGIHYFNTGIFVAKASVLIDTLNTFDKLINNYRIIVNDISHFDNEITFSKQAKERFSDLEYKIIESDLFEKFSNKLLVYKADFSFDDIGNITAVKKYKLTK